MILVGKFTPTAPYDCQWLLMAPNGFQQLPTTANARSCQLPMTPNDFHPRAGILVPHLHPRVLRDVAGGGGALAPYHLQSLEEFTRVLHLNVLGTMLCIKHSVPYLKKSGGGSFVGMSSIAGHLTHLWFGAYPAAKAGIEAMIRNAADEFGQSNIRFNAVRPGFIATEIMEGVPRDSKTFKSYIDNTPLGDIGTPEDVASLVEFLISSDSRWITGQCINVDGGHSLRRGPQFTEFLIGLTDEEIHGDLKGKD